MARALFAMALAQALVGVILVVRGKFRFGGLVIEHVAIGDAGLAFVRGQPTGCAIDGRPCS